ncbi:hypothetical protein Pcinc_021401 [Petrolisthes cinctipes]|uniref:Gamma-interferon-inducible lysosomal thiol reductase n=1 Tax=Petrolisthes cinctipes TaxID=88211 RepID=A0AAE1FHG5_PETCI|nr:hypothetical protein Pcinc_021401 [Petrolisthes cinctipes]
MIVTPAAAAANWLWLIQLITIIAVCMAAPREDAAPQVKVSVYYESLCPDSRNFFVNQLYPVWVDLSDIIDLQLTSYGKTRELSGDGEQYEFRCQHGPRECASNVMLTCANHYITDRCLQIDFAHCVMRDFQGTKSGKLCANETGVDFGPIKRCMRSSEGTQLQHQAGLLQATLSPPLDYVPWITINDVFTRHQLHEALRNLREVVCGGYQGTKPPFCNLELV